MLILYACENLYNYLFKKVVFLFSFLYAVNSFNFLILNHIFLTKLLLFFLLTKLVWETGKNLEFRSYLVILSLLFYLILVYWQVPQVYYNFNLPIYYFLEF